MEIRGISSIETFVWPVDSGATAPAPQQEGAGQDRIVVHVEEANDYKQVDDYLSGKVPQQGSNIVDLISKMVF